MPQRIGERSGAGGGRVGGGRGASSHTEEKIIVLDIYAQSDSDIENCQKELMSKLEKAMDTIRWSDKPTYKDDKELIKKLDPDTVS